MWRRRPTIEIMPGILRLRIRRDRGTEIVLQDLVKQAQKMTGQIAIFCHDEQCERSLARLLRGEDAEVVILANHVDLVLFLLEHDCIAAIYGLESPFDLGLKVVQILRKIRPKLPLIVISDEATEEIGGRILQEGVSYYTLKPVSPERFHQVMSTVLH